MSDGRRDFDGRCKDWTAPIISQDGVPVGTPPAKTPIVEELDDDAPGTNMYGVTPCPKCGDHFRWPDEGNILRCSKCDYVSQWKHKEPSNG